MIDWNVEGGSPSSRYGEARVAKAAIVSAVPPLMTICDTILT